jgi:hypothetical protein
MICHVAHDGRRTRPRRSSDSLSSTDLAARLRANGDPVRIATDKERHEVGVGEKLVDRLIKRLLHELRKMIHVPENSGRKKEVRADELTTDDRMRNRLAFYNGKWYRFEDGGDKVQLNTGIAIA